MQMAMKSKKNISALFYQNMPLSLFHGRKERKAVTKSQWKEKYSHLYPDSCNMR